MAPGDHLSRSCVRVGEGPNPRDQADFDRLKAYADILDTDVIAFQEVENQAAAEHVVDPANYQIFISDRIPSARSRRGWGRPTS